MRIDPNIEKQLKRIYGDNYDPKKVDIYLKNFVKKKNKKIYYRIFDLRYDEFCNDDIDSILDVIKENYQENLKDKNYRNFSLKEKINILEKYDFEVKEIK